MSELKVIKAYLPTFDADHNDMLLVSHTKENYVPAKQIEFYLKSEADNVIAEKDSEIVELKAQKAQAEDDCAYWKMNEGNATNAMHETEEYAMQLYNELRHQKYKRCLAMAEYCKAQYDYEDRCVNGNGLSWAYISPEMKYWERWKGRWLELAEKFKEAK